MAGFPRKIHQAHSPTALTSIPTNLVVLLSGGFK